MTHYQTASPLSRIGSFLLDMLILGVLGMFLSLFLKEYFIKLGSNGIFVGYTIAILYFSLLNSKLGKGKTIGKRAIKIMVIDNSDNLLSVSRSLIRSIIIITPLLLINYKIPGINELGYIQKFKFMLFLLLILGSILVLIINGKTRQSIHDLIVGSYVVKDTFIEDSVTMQELGKTKVLIICGSVIISFSIIFSIAQFRLPESLNDLEETHEKLMALDGVLNAGVNRNTSSFFGSEEKTESLIITVNILEFPDNEFDYKGIFDSKLGREICNIILENYPDIDSLDFIGIRMVRGYNIGISKGSRSINGSKSPSEIKGYAN